MSIHPSLVELRRKVDTFFERVMQSSPEQLACAPGCARCCAVDLTVFPVEAEPIRAALAELPEPIRATIHERKARGDHCVFLVENRCAIYHQRPIICRSQGLPLQTAPDERAVCPLNFEQLDLAELPDESVLNLNTLNTLLSVLHQVHCRQEGLPDRRERLADLTF